MGTLTSTSILVHRLTNAADLDDTAADIASNLLRVGSVVPPEDWLIVGGSLARGEPTIIRNGGSPLLISDVDLLYVHPGDKPSMRISDLIDIAEPLFPMVDLKVLSLKEFQVLQTSLGHDFKNLGLALTEHGLPPYVPVELDARDAYEILLYYTQAYFWCRVHDRWAARQDTPEFQLGLSRLCIKILRATAMLDGAYAHHDFDRMTPLSAERMRIELRWRADPVQPPLDPGRFWTYLADGLQRFDDEFGQQRPDAVHDSHYAATRSGRIVARHNRVAHHLARAMTNAWLGSTDPRVLARVMQRAWTQYTGRDGTHVHPGPEDYFAGHKGNINHHLFAMKVQAV